MSSRIGGRAFAIVLRVTIATVVTTSIWLAGDEAAAAVGPRDRRLTNVALGISVEAPAGWTLSQHTGYRETVVLLLHPDGSRISVNAAATPHRTVADFLKQNLRGLSASGVQVLSSTPGARGALMVDLAAPAGSKSGERLRQAYLVREIPGGWQAIVLTLVCREAIFSSRTPALDFVLNRMTLDEPPVPTGNARNGNGLPAAGGSRGRAGSSDGNGNASAQQSDKR
jgi:hypothetical protein